MQFPGYSPAPLGGLASSPKDAAGTAWVKKIAEVVNNILGGKLNVVLSVTLRASHTTTDIIDARIGPYSALLLQPLTTHAAAALYSATSVLVDSSSQKNGFVTLNHASLAQSDLTFNLVILG